MKEHEQEFIETANECSAKAVQKTLTQQRKELDKAQNRICLLYTSNTVLRNFPLFCPKCKLTHIVDVEKLEIIIKNSEKLRRSPAPVLSANKTVQEGISARSFGISRNFSCSLPTTPRKPEKADNGSIFSLIPSTDRKRILPTAAAIFPFAFSYWGFSKTPNGNEKKQQIR